MSHRPFQSASSLSQSTSGATRSARRPNTAITFSVSRPPSQLQVPAPLAARVGQLWTPGLIDRLHMPLSRVRE